MRNRKRRYILLALLIVTLGVGAFYAITTYRMSLMPSMSFEEMLDYTTKNNESAIITVGIIESGETSTTVYGENASILPKEDFEYEIGSITKTFTSSLLCKAISENKVELSDSIHEYIELPQKGYYPDFRRLLTHTSGYKEYYLDWQMVTNFFRKTNAFYGISRDELNTKTGKISIEDKDYPFEYSSFGISVVGSALSEIYASDFITVMQDFIESDLKLENTRISDGKGNMNGYWNWMPNDAYIPAGAIVSTMDDMMKYMQLHMSEALPYLSLGHEIHARVDATTKQYEKLGIRIDAAGLGWMIDTENNIIWHNGGTDNFNSYMAFDKDKQIGVVILSNLAPDYRIPATVMGAKLITALQE